MKSLLLGSAAGLAAVAGAQAADLPVRKAAPVEYVRVCTAYGAGYFYIPGTDTCIRIGGRARFEYQYTYVANRSGTNGDISGYRTLGRLNLDARTQTAYGTLRTFVRFDIASRSGAYFYSNTNQRFAGSYTAVGQDTYGRLQKFVDIDKAFVQFAGFTAGRAASFFDFYAADFELVGNSVGSNVSSTNLLAYTATFGQGFSATISMEDPTYRRSPVYSVTSTTLGTTAFSAYTSAVAVAPYAVVLDANGNPTAAALTDVTQKNRMPDFVGALRYDAPWGSAQISAAVHELNVGSSTSLVALNGGTTPAGYSAGRVQNEYGYSVQGGLKVNTPFIAPGDALYLQGAYGKGANYYTGVVNPIAGDTVSSTLYSGGQFPLSLSDSVINPLTGKQELTKSFSVLASYLHYWSPEWRSAVFGSYGEVYFSKSARYANALVGFGFTSLVQPTAAAAASAANAYNYSAALRDYSILYVGASLIWSPVRDLDIGVEGVYQRAALLSGSTNDLNKNPAGTAVNGVPVKTVSTTDNFLVRFRVQRDF